MTPAAAPVIDWLLEEDNPPVRYLTLKHLLHKRDADPDVRRAKARLMDYGPTRAILDRERDWADGQPYKKYTGKYWQLIFLGQFLADGRDPRITPHVEELLADPKWVTSTGGQCLTANLLVAFSRLGYADHPVVRRERQALAERVVRDGGVDCSAMAYSLLPHCYMANPKLLLCFSQPGAEDRSPVLRSAIRLLADCLLQRQVFVYVPGHQNQWLDILNRLPARADLPSGTTVKSWIARRRSEFLVRPGLGSPKVKPGWLKFGFPLHYNSDVLEAMHALANAGVPMSAALERPLAAIREKMTAEGRWTLESSLNGKMWTDVEEKGKPSKWVTWFALRVLAHFAGGAGNGPVPSRS